MGEDLRKSGNVHDGLQEGSHMEEGLFFCGNETPIVPVSSTQEDIHSCLDSTLIN